MTAVLMYLHFEEEDIGLTPQVYHGEYMWGYILIDIIEVLTSLGVQYKYMC